MAHSCSTTLLDPRSKPSYPREEKPGSVRSYYRKSPSNIFRLEMYTILSPLASRSVLMAWLESVRGRTYNRISRLSAWLHFPTRNSSSEKDCRQKVSGMHCFPGRSAQGFERTENQPSRQLATPSRTLGVFFEGRMLQTTCCQWQGVTPCWIGNFKPTAVGRSSATQGPIFVPPSSRK